MRKSKGQTIDSFYTNKDEKIKKEIIENLKM